MTTRARAVYMGMVYSEYRTPQNCAVAGFANFGGGNMLCGTSRRTDSVMTIDTVCRNAGVVERHTQPRRGHMARVTCPCGWNMGRTFSAGAGSIMTGCARAQYLGVIHPHCRAPQRCAVARFTPFRCRKVRRRFSDCIDTIVAAIASIDDAWVTE